MINYNNDNDNYRPSVEEYFEELIDINDKLVEQIFQGTEPNALKNKIKSKTIMISLQEIQVIVDSIMRHQEEIKKLCPQAVNLAQK